MIYLDSSYLVKLYLHEHGSEEVEAWLSSQSGQVVCCLHGRLELIAALKRQQREDKLTEAQLRATVKRLEQEETSGVIRWIPIDSMLMESACARMQKFPPSVFLRAADALHLACAAAAGLKQICSHDRHLLAAAPHFGLKGLDIINSAHLS